MRLSHLGYALFAAATLSLAGVGSAAAQAVEGELNRTNFTHVGCSIADMDVRYRLGALMGEPTVNGNVSWQGAAGEREDCLPPSVKIWLRVVSGSAVRWIEVAPTVPKSGGGWGFNVMGSPSWDAVLCDVGGGSCLPRDQARAFWAGGMAVTGFELRGGEEVVAARDAREAADAARAAAREAADAAREADRVARQQAAEQAEREAEERRLAEEEERARESEARAREAEESARRSAHQSEQERIRAETEAARERHAAQARADSARVDARNDSVMSEAERIGRTADSIEDGEIRDGIDRAAGAYTTAAFGLAGQILADGLYIGVGLATTRMNWSDQIVSLSAWSPRRSRVEMLLNVTSMFMTVDEMMEEDLDVQRLEMAWSYTQALDFWTWLDVYDEPHMRGAIPYPSILAGIAAGDWDGEGRWAPIYGIGFMWGGPSIPLLFALDFVRVHGKEPGELRSDEGFLDREDMIVQFSFATNFAW